MKRNPIPIDEFSTRAVHLWAHRWMLLTAGDFAAREFNTMTVAWGAFGCMWGEPFAHVVVRPSRYTYEFMQKYETFTLTAFPPDCQAALQLLGTSSGRDGDKIAEAGLTPKAATAVAAPVFAEAELAVECRTAYRQDLDPNSILDPSLRGIYVSGDVHRAYFGVILAVTGTDAFRARS